MLSFDGKGNTKGLGRRYKTCTDCGEVKAENQFGVSPQGKPYKQCRKCISAKARDSVESKMAAAVVPWEVVCQCWQLDDDEQHAVDMAARQAIKHQRVRAHNRRIGEGGPGERRPLPVHCAEDLIRVVSTDWRRQCELLAAASERMREILYTAA